MDIEYHLISFYFIGNANYVNYFKIDHSYLDRILILHEQFSDQLLCYVFINYLLINITKAYLKYKLFFNW